ncbi:MAG: DUF3575 domain-containing protein [Clostridium sp.]|nr:DUF3575 domain-containing protein [Clostridium sp.]
MKTIIKGILLLLCLWVVPGSAQQRARTTGEKLDTLAFGKRLSFHTNMIDWLTGTPNATVELDVTGSPYNRLAVLAGMKYNWNTRHTQNPRIVYNVFELNVEGRYYWHTRSEGVVWKPDSNVFFLKNAWHHFRTRAAVKKRPRSYRAYYIGLYGEYDKHTILMGNGIQGKGAGVGVSGGFTQPLYQLRHGSIEFEVGARAGFRYTRFDKFSYEEESACYAYTETKQKHFVPFPVIQDVHVSLVYRMASSKNKYKWNKRRADDWDNAWVEKAKKHQDEADSVKLKRTEKNARRKFVADSLSQEKNKKRLADSLQHEYKKYQADSLKMEKKMADSLADLRKRFVADSVRQDKRMRDSLERAEKAAAKLLKKASKNRKDSLDVYPGDSIAVPEGNIPAVMEEPIDTVARIEEVVFPDAPEEQTDSTEVGDVPVPEVMPEEPDAQPDESTSEETPDEPAEEAPEVMPEEPVEKPEEETSDESGEGDSDLDNQDMQLKIYATSGIMRFGEKGGLKA